MMTDLDREFSAAYTALSRATDADRGDLLLDLAQVFHHATVDSGHPDTDRTTSLVLELLADVDWAATGRTTGRHTTGTHLEPTLGPILDRMAMTPDVDARAVLLAELWLVLGDDDTAETLACMTYAPGKVGWTADEPWPTERTWRGFVQALGVAWRSRSAR